MTDTERLNDYKSHKSWLESEIDRLENLVFTLDVNSYNDLKSFVIHSNELKNSLSSRRIEHGRVCDWIYTLSSRIVEQTNYGNTVTCF